MVADQRGLPGTGSGNRPGVHCSDARGGVLLGARRVLTSDVETWMADAAAGRSGPFLEIDAEQRIVYVNEFAPVAVDATFDVDDVQRSTTCDRGRF